MSRLSLGSLCSGAGMLDQAAAAVVGAEQVWCAEKDAAAALVLEKRVGGPNLGDITAVDWTRVEPVDVLVAGYPCQDLSNAGKRAGIEGSRSGVWRNVADAIRVLRPRLVLLENVRGHLARGFGRVLGDLAELGYDAGWTCLRASDVGAPHQRDRVFIAAAAADTDGFGVRVEPVAVGARLGEAVVGGDREGVLIPTPTAALARGSGMPSPDLAESRRGEGRRFLDDAVALLPTPRGSEGAKGGPNQRGSSGDLTLTSAALLLPTPTAVDAKGARNATSGRRSGTAHHDGWTLSDIAHAERWAQYGAAIARWEGVTGRTAPDPTVVGKRGGRRLSARFVEWLMGWPDGWVTDLLDNTDALRVCGNGVVPQQAAVAYRSLLPAPSSPVGAQSE